MILSEQITFSIGVFFLGYNIPRNRLLPQVYTPGCDLASIIVHSRTTSVCLNNSQFFLLGLRGLLTPGQGSRNRGRYFKRTVISRCVPASVLVCSLLGAHYGAERWRAAFHMAEARKDAQLGGVRNQRIFKCYGSRVRDNRRGRILPWGRLHDAQTDLFHVLRDRPAQCLWPDQETELDRR